MFKGKRGFLFIMPFVVLSVFFKEVQTGAWGAQQETASTSSSKSLTNLESSDLKAVNEMFIRNSNKHLDELIKEYKKDGPIGSFADEIELTVGNINMGYARITNLVNNLNPLNSDDRKKQINKVLGAEAPLAVSLANLVDRIDNKIPSVFSEVGSGIFKDKTAVLLKNLKIYLREIVHYNPSLTTYIPSATFESKTPTISVVVPYEPQGPMKMPSAQDQLTIDLNNFKNRVVNSKSEVELEQVMEEFRQYALLKPRSEMEAGVKLIKDAYAVKRIDADLQRRTDQELESLEKTIEENVKKMKGLIGNYNKVEIYITSDTLGWIMNSTERRRNETVGTLFVDENLSFKTKVGDAFVTDMDNRRYNEQVMSKWSTLIPNMVYPLTTVDKNNILYITNDLEKKDLKNNTERIKQYYTIKDTYHKIFKIGIKKFKNTSYFALDSAFYTVLDDIKVIVATVASVIKENPSIAKEIYFVVGNDESLRDSYIACWLAEINKTEESPSKWFEKLNLPEQAIEIKIPAELKKETIAEVKIEGSPKPVAESISPPPTKTASIEEPKKAAPTDVEPETTTAWLKRVMFGRSKADRKEAKALILGKKPEIESKVTKPTEPELTIKTMLEATVTPAPTPEPTMVTTPAPTTQKEVEAAPAVDTSLAGTLKAFTQALEALKTTIW